MHTPTPWTYDKAFRALRGKQRGEVAYNLTCTDEDAALIVKAVNAHNLMLDTLRGLKDYFDPGPELDAIEKAIANAEGLAEGK